jgi:hypothetical protein
MGKKLWHPQYPAVRGEVVKKKAFIKIKKKAYQAAEPIRPKFRAR